MAIPIKTQLDQLPTWLYDVSFNYAYLDSEVINYAEQLSESYDRYTLYNKRRRPCAFLTIKKSMSSGHLQGYEGELTLTPWSWDEFPSIAENRLGLDRPEPYRFEDRLKAEIKCYFARGTYTDGFGKKTGLVVWQIDEKHFYYDAYGRLVTMLQASRAPENVKIGEETLPKSFAIDSFLTFLTGAASFRIITDQNRHFFNNSATISSIFLVKPPIYEASRTIYTELSAEIHRTETEVAAYDKTTGNLQQVSLSSDLVLSPIPTIARVPSLDTGKWLPVSLEDSPTAVACRYNGWVFNNAYYNMNLPNDVGFQQLLAAVETDFVFAWERSHSGDFNDVRTLKNSLLGYINLLAAFVCQALRIRIIYITYVAELITLFELTRGVPRPLGRDYGVHASYPFYERVKELYEGYLERVFALIRVDLGANDGEMRLTNHYKEHIATYNRCVSGYDVESGLALAMLGESAKNNAAANLSAHYQFLLRYLWANIDQALSDAFVQDVALSGNVSINDPAFIVNPGDSVELHFLDDTFIRLKTMAVTLSLSPERIDYSIAVKRSLV